MKVVFLDRDDTLNEDPGYLNDASRVRLLPGVAEGLQRLQAAGYQFIILTNQSGIGRGLITAEQLEAVHRQLLHLLALEGVQVLDILFCPHVPDDRCECRKPAAGLLWKALELHPQIDVGRSWMIGDRYRDLQPGLHTRVDGKIIPGILVGSKEEPGTPPANLKYRVADLNEAADCILGDSRG